MAVGLFVQMFRNPPFQLLWVYTQTWNYWITWQFIFFLIFEELL